MELIIEPYVQCGPIRFGMSRDQVRALVRSAVEPFQRVEGMPLIDAFPELGVHVHYKDPDVVEAVEVFSPSVPLYLGRPLLGVPYAGLRSWFKDEDAAVEIRNDGLTAPTLGISLYAPHLKKSAKLPCECVMAYERGYYERWATLAEKLLPPIPDDWL